MARVTDEIGKVLPILSRWACNAVSAVCDNPDSTISGEFAENLGTNLQGAHLWMLSPFLLEPALGLGPLAEQIAVEEIDNAYAAGGISAVRRAVEVPHISTPRLDRKVRRVLARRNGQSTSVEARDLVQGRRRITGRRRSILKALARLGTINGGD